MVDATGKRALLVGIGKRAATGDRRSRHAARARRRRPLPSMRISMGRMPAREPDPPATLATMGPRAAASSGLATHRYGGRPVATVHRRTDLEDFVSHSLDDTEGMPWMVEPEF